MPPENFIIFLESFIYFYNKTSLDPANVIDFKK